MHEIQIRRRESKSHLPPPVLANSKVMLSSVYVGQGPLKGLDKEEEEKLLAKYLGIDPDEKDFHKTTRSFWADLRVEIPSEGKVLNIGTTEGEPHNIYDYIVYQWAIKHPYVAKDLDEMLGSSRYKYYIYDPEIATQKANQKVNFKKKAYEEFITIGDDETKIDRLIRLLTDSRPEEMSLKQKQNYLDQEIENDPQRFFVTSTDKHLEIKSIISELVGEGIINKIGNQHYFIDEKLGETLDETVKYFNDKKNSETVNILKAKLQEAKK